MWLLDPDQQPGIHSLLTPKRMGKNGRAKAREKSLVRIKSLMSERKRDEQKLSHAKQSSPPTSRLVPSQFPSNCYHGRASHQLFTAGHNVVWHSIPLSSGQLTSCPPSAYSLWWGGRHSRREKALETCSGKLKQWCYQHISNQKWKM